MLVTALPHAAKAADTSSPKWSATIAGEEVGDASSSHPLTLDPKNETPVVLRVENNGTSRLTIHSLRVEGRILGLVFYQYTDAIDLIVDPGSKRSTTVYFDLADLDGQATGLIPSTFMLLGEDGQTLASDSFPADVNGSLWSVYGVFGLAVGAITLLMFGSLLLKLTFGRLPDNRWQRALSFAVPGLGLGATLTFTLSALGWLVPSQTAWLLAILLCGAAAFAVGYLTPTPGPEFDEDREQDEQTAEPNEYAYDIPRQGGYASADQPEFAGAAHADFHTADYDPADGADYDTADGADYDGADYDGASQSGGDRDGGEPGPR